MGELTAPSRELRHNALSRLDSVLIAVSGTAPANSLAVSTAALVAAVGLFGPGALLFGALSMFGIAIAYYYLNAWRSDAGASYAWVGRSLSPSLGFFAGWSILVANIIFMVAGSLPAASATLDLVAPQLANSVVAVTEVGAAWFLLVNIVVLVGIRTTAYFQKIVTSIEIGGILVLAVAGITKATASHAHVFSLAWFSPLGPGSVGAFMAGALVVLFYFWGWDVTANLTEETIDRTRAPGLGGLGGMLVILGLFVVAQVSMQLTLSPRAITDSASNVLDVFANAILPRPWGDLAVVVVIVSTIGALETSLLAVSRTLLSMSRDRVISSRFAEIHPRFATPWFGSIVMGVLALALFAAAAASASLSGLLREVVNAVGVYIAIYYGLSAFACAWYYRRTLAGDIRALWLKGIWPAAAGLFLWVVAVAQLLQAGWRADSVMLGLLAIGAVPLFLYRRRYRSDFYQAELEACPAAEGASP